MLVLGIDFTSRPSRRKPITCLPCEFDGAILRAQTHEEWTSFRGFEDRLARPGSWIAGIDLPFGQARRFIENIGWPQSWAAYVEHADKLGRNGFRDALTAYKSDRPAGDKEHLRETDEAAGSKSPQKLFGVPVGLMFFEGAPRLLAAGITIPHLLQGDPQRIVVEAYPGVLARRFIDRRSYKNDASKKQTPEQFEARRELIERLRKEAPNYYGFAIDAPNSLCDDPGGDHLDSLLCAVQACWAWQQRTNGFGAPKTVDPLEGWIADPQLVNRDGHR